MLSPKIYSFQVPANGSLPLQLTGRYFRINAATNPVAVTIDGLGTLGAVGAGQGLKLRDTDKPFERLVFTDTSGAANNVTVIVADSDFVDNTVLGSVSVIDGGKSRTLAGQAFSGGVSQPGIAAKFSSAQVVNSAGSGKRFIVEQVTFQCTNADGVTLYPGLAQLTTLVDYLRSKNGAGFSSSTRMFTDSTAGFLGAGISTFGCNVPASGSFTFTPKEPLILHPGQTLTGCASTAANSFGMSVEGYEEADA